MRKQHKQQQMRPLLKLTLMHLPLLLPPPPPLPPLPLLLQQLPLPRLSLREKHLLLLSPRVSHKT
jgi:hypothetical protein